MVSNALGLAIAKAIASGQGAYKNKIDKEYGAMGANIAASLQAILFAAAAEAKGDGFWGSLGDFMKAKPVQWLENGIAVIACLDFLNGLSSPDKGLSLTDGGAGPNFDSAMKSLRLAIPDESKWSGPAATAYRDIVKKLQQAVAEVKQADAKIQQGVEAQAHMIIRLRTEFAITKGGLIVAMAPALVIYVETYATRLTFYLAEEHPTPTVAAQKDALAATRKFQLATIGVAMIAIVGFITCHTTETLSNSAAVASLAGSQYDGAARLVPSPSKAIPTQNNPAPSAIGATKVPSFQRLSGGGGNSSEASSYPVAGGTGRANAPSYPNAGGTGTANAPSYPVAGGTGAVSTPLAPSAASGTATAPTTAAAGQAGQGAKPPVSSTPIAKPPKQTGAPGTHVDSTGAAIGAEGTERAPIETPAASPGHAPQPTSSTDAL